MNYFEYNHTLALLQNQNDYNNSLSQLFIFHTSRGIERASRPYLVTDIHFSLRFVCLISDTGALLEEVICQRIAQDYQHIVSDEIPLPKDAKNVTVMYFSLRNQVHQITMDKRTNTIDVRRHVHKRVFQDHLKLVKFPYSYFLWSPHTASFVGVQRDIEPNRDELKWSDADNLLCDRYSQDLTEAMKYRRNQSVG